MQNMNSYQSNLTVGHYSKNYGIPFPPIQQQFLKTPNPTHTANNDIVKLLSVLFQGKVCVYIDKLKNKQKLLFRAEAEVYIGNYYPLILLLATPFDPQGHLYEGISIEYIVRWFEAEDGFSKFEFRYPINDEEKDNVIKTIFAQIKYFGITTANNVVPAVSTGTFYSTANGTAQPTI
jgi:hypothetical protein